MKEIKNKYNYYLRSILVILILIILLIVPFIIFLPEGLLFGIPAFLLLLRLFIYVNITQRIIVGPGLIIVTSYKFFFFRRMNIPDAGVEFRIVPIRSQKGVRHSLEIVKEGRVIYEVFDSEGFSEEQFKRLLE